MRTCPGCNQSLSATTITYRQQDVDLWVWELMVLDNRIVWNPHTEPYFIAMDTEDHWVECSCGQRIEAIMDDDIVEFLED